ncbi:MAG TPA: DUF2927 domain-containing protein [Bacteroidetes bacterium]|nr:DUF2927 domain-containing protein [Bacteroidota bacterium]
MKKFLLFFMLLPLFIFTACQKDLSLPDPSDTVLSKEFEYFKEIALGSEFSSGNKFIKKWDSNLRIFLMGEDVPELNQELDAIIAELEVLASPIKFHMVDTKADANYIIYFGKSDDYVNLVEPAASSKVADNWGLFWIYWDSNCIINKGSMYVDTHRTQRLAEKKHLLREEFTQSLGLMNDSYKYEESIFQQKWTSTISYADIDKQLIQILYDPRIKTCMNETEVNEVLKNW